MGNKHYNLINRQKKKKKPRTPIRLSAEESTTRLALLMPSHSFKGVIIVTIVNAFQCLQKPPPHGFNMGLGSLPIHICTLLKPILQQSHPLDIMTGLLGALRFETRFELCPLGFLISLVLISYRIL